MQIVKNHNIVSEVLWLYRIVGCMVISISRSDSVCMCLMFSAQENKPQAVWSVWAAENSFL